MATRPSIQLQPGVDNDIYTLLNAQAGYPAVTVGDPLRIQNKSGKDIYIHEGLASIEPKGGVTLPKYWQACTKEGAAGVIATCDGEGVINVEVI